MIKSIFLNVNFKIYILFFYHEINLILKSTEISSYGSYVKPFLITTVKIIHNILMAEQSNVVVWTRLPSSVSAFEYVMPCCWLFEKD